MAHVAQADVLDEGGVHVHALDDLLEHLDDEAVDGRVLEAALAALGQGRPDRERDDDIIGVLLGAVLVRFNLLMNVTNSLTWRRVQFSGPRAGFAPQKISVARPPCLLF
jgi:hypothetical protein